MRSLRALKVAYVAAIPWFVGCASFEKDPSDWLGHDKIAHFTASAALAAAGYDQAVKNGKSECEAVQFGLAFSIAIGAGKEAKDFWISHSYWSSKDMVADILGALTGAILASDC